jgi:hypothetical protein
MLDKLFYTGPSLTTLHEDCAKRHRIDTAAPVTSSSTIDVAAPIDRVWRALVDLQTWHEWAPHVAVLQHGDVCPDEPFTWRTGGFSIRSRFAVVEEKRELSWTGVFFGFKAVDRQVLELLEARRTRVTIEESLAGPLLPLLYSAAKLRVNHERWLNALKRFVEDGVPDPVA